MLLRTPARFVLTVALLIGSVSSVLAQRDEPTKSNPKVLDAFKSVVAKAGQSVVDVLSGGKKVALGTVVGSDGWVLTKNSVLGDKVELKIGEGDPLPATVVGVKDDYDLAMLKVSAKDLKAVQWQPTKEAAPGDWVVTAGPGKVPVAVGVVSVATRKMTRRDYPPQTNPNSGFLGINLGDPDGGGVKIGGVQENTAASKAGLKVGDVILSINAKPITDPETLMNTIGRYKPNDTITIKIKRDGKEEEIKATLGKRPGNLSRGDFQNRLGNEMSERRAGFPAILQHDTVVKPSECGGPLLDLDGKALGLNIARAGRTETYAIPSENVVALLDDLKSGKLAPRATGDPTKKPASEKVKKLQEAVKQAEGKQTEAEGKLAAAKKLAEEARQAADKLGKGNPKVMQIGDLAREVTAQVEKDLAAAKKQLDDAKAELKKAEDEEKK